MTLRCSNEVQMRSWSAVAYKTIGSQHAICILCFVSTYIRPFIVRRKISLDHHRYFRSVVEGLQPSRPKFLISIFLRILMRFVMLICFRSRMILFRVRSSLASAGGCRREDRRTLHRSDRQPIVRERRMQSCSLLVSGAYAYIHSSRAHCKHVPLDSEWMLTRSRDQHELNDLRKDHVSSSKAACNIPLVPSVGRDRD